MTGLVPLDVPIGIGAEEARRRALDELAKAKYGGAPDWLTDALRRVNDFLDALARLLGGLGGPRSSGGISPGFVVVAAVLLIGIALVVWKVGLPRWRSRTRPEQGLQLEPERPAHDYRSVAAAAAAAGDWRAAVRDRFRALVRELEVLTVLDVRPGRTAYEAAYVASRRVPGAREDLFRGAEIFGAVVYGDRPADATTYAEVAGIDDRVVALAGTADLAADEDADRDADHRTASRR